WGWVRVRAGLGIVLLTGIAAVLRFYRLGAESFWIDEVWTVQVAAQRLAGIVANYDPRVDLVLRDQAPLAFLLEHFFITPEASEWYARLPSAVFGILGVLAVFRVGRELLPHPGPLLAAAFLALSPLHVWYSQEVRWYAQWTLLMTLSYGALMSAWKTGSRR